MTNKEIAASFQLLAKLMELHGENPFKIRSYQKAYAHLGKMGTPLGSMTEKEISALPGVGKAITGKIGELLDVGKMNTLERFKEKTPEGIQELVMIKGLGPKKIMTAWKSLGVESATELLYACTENRLVELKGFGAKTQKEVQRQLEFFLQNRSKFIHLKVRDQAQGLLIKLREAYPKRRFELTGAFRRCQPVVCKVEYLCEGDASVDLSKVTPDIEINSTEIDKVEATFEGHLPVTFYFAGDHSFEKEWLRTTGPKSLYERIINQPVHIEQDAFDAISVPFITPEARDLLKEGHLPPQDLIMHSDLKGVIHAHSTYSDGVDSIEDLASYCKSKGYEYLGLTDHSQIAVYANGLNEERLMEQWTEIERLNATETGFLILKGIECDILSNGDLDYNDQILSQFDFVIASIHTNIKMDEAKATQRLLKAIENPFTNILGHPTGRLLLGREGYPLDMQRVIDACAANQVAIELNVSPYRLDLDWRWIAYAMDRGVLVSVNPDAHAKEAIDYLDFGVKIARKGWLPKSMCLNARDVEGFRTFCQK